MTISDPGGLPTCKLWPTPAEKKRATTLRGMIQSLDLAKIEFLQRVAAR